MEDFRSPLDYDQEEWIEEKELRLTWIEWEKMCLGE